MLEMEKNNKPEITNALDINLIVRMITPYKILIFIALVISINNVPSEGVR